MSVSGLCELCQDATAVDRCERCGAVVCAEHYAADIGYCLDCARQAGPGEPGDYDEGDTFQM